MGSIPYKKKVAIVGSGVSGIGALWALQRSTDYEIHLFEAADRLGGHTNTVLFEKDGKKTPVDTGFIVMNTATYPNFIAFLKEIGVRTKKTEMTFGVTRDQGKFEWAGTNLASIFAQKRNLFSPSMWRMIFDIVRFNQFALDLLVDSEESENDPVTGKGGENKSRKSQKEMSIGEYLDREGYSRAFIDNYLIPMTACVWSTSPDKCSLQFPALTLIRFLWNHHLLNTIAERAPWMTIPGGTKQYIDAVMSDFPEKNIHLNTPVTKAQNTYDGSVRLTFENGSHQDFHHVILACHGDQAYDIIKEDATPTERSIMSSFKTSENTAVLHSDLSFMPTRKIAWSAWNYLTTSHASAINTVTLTYWMNLLQHIPSSKFGPVLVTLNPPYAPDPSTVQGEWTYHHPLYNESAIRAQERLPQIQNMRGISYAGAWTKYGFHEDGFSSGVKAAMEIGAKIPWTFVDSTFSRGRMPSYTVLDRIVRVIVLVLQVGIVIVERVLAVFGL